VTRAKSSFTFQIVGASFAVAFDIANDAHSAALDSQRALTRIIILRLDKEKTSQILI
jgi:hypothetical protein